MNFPRPLLKNLIFRYLSSFLLIFIPSLDLDQNIADYSNITDTGDADGGDISPNLRSGTLLGIREHVADLS